MSIYNPDNKSDTVERIVKDFLFSRRIATDVIALLIESGKSEKEVREYFVNAFKDNHVSTVQAESWYSMLLAIANNDYLKKSMKIMDGEYIRRPSAGYFIIQYYIDFEEFTKQQSVLIIADNDKIAEEKAKEFSSTIPSISNVEVSPISKFEFDLLKSGLKIIR